MRPIAFASAAPISTSSCHGAWPPEQIQPNAFEYARLEVAHDSPEFCPRFDPILYAEEQDFSVSGSRLSWWEGRHFHCVTRDGKRVLVMGSNPDG